MSKWRICVIFAALCLCGLIVTVQATGLAGGGIGASGGIDAILVIDTSGSMRESDPERTTIEAAQLFIDMLETRHSRVGIIEFTDVLHTVVPLTSVNSVQEREALRNTISGFEYGGWTDIGLALRTATEMMLETSIESDVSNNSPLIILFTDGAIELAPWREDRTVEMSYADVEWALDALAGSTPIYTIGLNYHDDVNIPFLQGISEQTTALNFIVDEPGGLPVIFSEIFANHIRSSLTQIADFIASQYEYTEVIIPISSSFVAEANIIMLSDQPIASVFLSDPNGNRVDFDGVNHILTYANRYSMIKSINPAVGDWTLSVLGVPDERVTVNLIYNFELDVFIEVTQGDMLTDLFDLFDPSRPISVRAGFVLPDGEALPDSLFASSAAELHVFNMAMEQMYSVAMLNTGQDFRVDYIQSAGENVNVTVSIWNPDFFISSRFFNISFGEPTAYDNYGQEPIAASTPVVAIEYEPDEEIRQESEASESGISFTTILNILIPLTVLPLLLLLFVIFVKRRRRAMWSGRLTVRWESYSHNVDLEIFHGKENLHDLLSLGLGARGRHLLRSIDLSGISMWSDSLAGATSIGLKRTRGNIQILTDESKPINMKKPYFWVDNEQLFFTIPSEEGHDHILDITYRNFDAENDIGIK